MKISLIVFAATVLSVTSCNSNNQDESAELTNNQAADSSTANQVFFPVYSYLKSEIAYVDSLPVGILKYHTAGRKTDSTYIKAEEFHRLADEFLSPELDESSFKKNFVESSFFDRSTNKSTFFYKARDTGLAVQRVDVVTTKGDVYDEVTSLYMETKRKEGERILNKRLFWKPKRNFQIININADASPKEKVDVIKVVWDNRE